MNKKSYYSVRTGKNPNVKYNLSMLLRLFHNTYMLFLLKDYFQEAFGYECVDAGKIAGTLGLDIEAQMFRNLRKPNLWPIQEKCHTYSEDDLFDVIEFLFDSISKPIDGDFHSWNECGWHYKTFDQEAGRTEFRTEINQFLRDYKSGFELSEEGEILEIVDKGLEHIYEAAVPSNDPANIEVRVDAAILKFRRHRSSLEDRRDAVRGLADVLEFLRPKLKQVIVPKDESDLFNIANNFGIRHHNENQKTDYDKPIWYSWMFCYYLATIHASLRLIEKHENNIREESK